MKKKDILIMMVLLAGLILVIRVFFLQIVSNEYKINADNNALLYRTLYPARGEIYDRTGKTLVGNKISHDIMVTPIDIKPFDTADFCSVFNISPTEVKKKLRNYRKNKKKIGYQTFTFIKQVGDVEFYKFAEKTYKFPGFFSTNRTIRTYPLDAGANLFGYINEADAEYLLKHPESKLGDYVGITGLESSYENVLKGEKGYNILVRDVHNRVRSTFKNGAYDKSAIPGTNLTASIDGDLQQYGELLMKNKVGSIVAIEPATGEILAIISAPGLTTEQLPDIRKHYNEILQNPYKPMFNRAVMSAYPPGSVFKTINALIAQQNGVITEDTKFSCEHGYTFPGGRMGCHGHPSPINLKESIMMSCNSYYANTFRAILRDPKYENIADAFNHWKSQVMKFGFGKKLGSDFPAELQGTLPSTETYDKIHGKDKWNAYNILPLAIGQGEIGATPLHIANLAAIIANRGYYIIPHLIKAPVDSTLKGKYTEKHYVGIDREYFTPVIEGMYLAVNCQPGMGGTARMAAIPGVSICGKTGTAQNPHGKDHSVFMCFAPQDSPKIAVAVYLENAGFGASWAVPIASLMVEKYLNKEVKRQDLETRMIEADLKANVPIKNAPVKASSR